MNSSTNYAPHPQIPDKNHRAGLNAAFAANGSETGFWDQHGQPAPWPHDIEEWSITTTEPHHPTPAEQPF